MNKSIILTNSMSFLLMTLTAISRKQHLLPLLLCLEGMMLFMMFLIPLSTTYQYMMMASIMVIMLMISAASASIGLTLLVMSCRTSGNDSLPSNMILSC